MKLVNLAMKPKETQAEAPCTPDPGDQPKYPYGTQLYLCEDELKKLGMKEMPTVGTEVPIMAVAKVVGTSERETQEGSRKTLDLQITSMGFDLPEEPTTAMGKAAKKLYG